MDVSLSFSKSFPILFELLLTFFFLFISSLQLSFSVPKYFG